MQGFGIRGFEWLIILLIILILFGANRLPALARAVGDSVREFRKATTASEPASLTDPLIEAARKLGISTEGKPRKQIAAEVANRAGETV